MNSTPADLRSEDAALRAIVQVQQPIKFRITRAHVGSLVPLGAVMAASIATLVAFGSDLGRMVGLYQPAPVVQQWPRQQQTWPPAPTPPPRR